MRQPGKMGVITNRQSSYHKKLKRFLLVKSQIKTNKSRSMTKIIVTHLRLSYKTTLNEMRLVKVCAIERDFGFNPENKNSCILISGRE